MKGFHQKWLILNLGLAWRLMTWRKAQADSQRMRQLEYPASTQRMGLRFTEKIRDTFRHRWLRIHR
jgi:hypothetical protein